MGKDNIISNGCDTINIPITIDEMNVIDGAKEIIKVLRPSWDFEHIKFKSFTDGITNKLIGCFHTPISPTAVQRSDYAILIRIYGNKTDLLIDRQAERKNIQLLQSYGLAPSLYAIFNNGIVYEYVPGTPVTSETIIKPTIWPLIARNMAKMHKVQTTEQQQLIMAGINSRQPQPMLWNKFEQFLQLIPDRFSDADVQKRVDQSNIPVKNLRKEIATLAEHLNSLNSPIVFAHNDLLLGNLIYTETENKITFIDYEYAAYNYQAFDIGNHFCEFAGLDTSDKTLYPGKEFQLQWLKEYLTVWREDDENSSVTRSDIERLYVQANKFALASYLFWTVWALIQAEHSTISFDFVQFGQARYVAYLARKDEFLAL